MRAAFGAGFGSLGPIRSGAVAGDAPSITFIADHAVASMSDFGVGANEDGMHFTGVNWGRDLPEPTDVADLRNAVEGDPSPSGTGKQIGRAHV